MNNFESGTNNNIARVGNPNMECLMYDNLSLEELREELKMSKFLNACEGGGYKREIKLLKELIAKLSKSK